MLESERLILRPFENTQEDLGLIMALYTDPEIMRYVPYDLMNRVQAEEHLARIAAEWKQENALNFEMAVILKDGQAPIGRAHYHLKEENDSAMIGLMLLKTWWGKGLAREAVLAMIDCCFDRLNLHRVTGLWQPENIASRRTMERCGMRLEAYFRQSVRYVKNGKERWEDELAYAILREESLRHKHEQERKILRESSG